MNQCDYIASHTPFYLDDELRPDERRAFEDHLGRCETCRAAVSSERRFLESIRQAGPLYETPVDLRNSIEEIASHGGLRDTSAYEQAPRSRLDLLVADLRAARFGRIQRVAAVSAIGILLAVLGIFYFRRSGEAPARSPSEFAVLAVAIHQQHLVGGLDLEVTSTSPQDVSKWLAGQISFGLKLPNYQEVSGQDQLYQIEGGSVVRFKNDYAAYVSYQMDRQTISLLVTSDSVAAPAGGEEIVSKGIAFHCDAIDGLKVITWSDRGLTYALVSNLRERGQQSCLVCHQGTKDTDFLEGFDIDLSGGGQSSRMQRLSSATKLDPNRRLPRSALD